VDQGPSLLPLFPPGQRRWVDSEPARHGLLCEPEFAASRDETVGCRASQRQRIVAKKADYSRQLMDLGRICVSFPVVNRVFRHTNLRGNLFLKQSPIKPLFSDMVA